MLLAELSWRCWHLCGNGKPLVGSFVGVVVWRFAPCRCRQKCSARRCNTSGMEQIKNMFLYRPKSCSKVVNFKYEFPSRSAEAGGETAQDVSGAMQKC